MKEEIIKLLKLKLGRDMNEFNSDELDLYLRDYGSIYGALQDEGNILTEEDLISELPESIQELCRNSKIVDEQTESIVIHFSKIDLYVKIMGYWSSYDGYELTGIKEVKPVEKLVTVYEPLK